MRGLAVLAAWREKTAPRWVAFACPRCVEYLTRRHEEHEVLYIAEAAAPRFSIKKNNARLCGLCAKILTMKHMKLHESFVLFVFFVVKRNIHHRVHRGHRGLRHGRAGSPSPPRKRCGRVSVPDEVHPRKTHVASRKTLLEGRATCGRQEHRSGGAARL